MRYEHRRVDPNGITIFRHQRRSSSHEMALDSSYSRAHHQGFTVRIQQFQFLCDFDVEH